MVDWDGFYAKLDWAMRMASFMLEVSEAARPPSHTQPDTTASSANPDPKKKLEH